MQAVRDWKAGSTAAPESNTPHWLVRLAALNPQEQSAVITLRGLAMFAGLMVVLLSASLAARWLGRRTGLLAGLVAATSLGLSAAVWHSGPAIWLAAATLLTIRLFSAIEFPSEPDRLRRLDRMTLARGRAVRVAAFVSWLGLAAVLFGPVEVVVLLVLPVAVFLVQQPGGAAIGFLRSPGWLIACGLVFAGVSYGFVDWPSRLTAVHLAGGATSLERLRELGRTVMPWGILVPLGLWLTRHEAIARRHSHERLLLCATLAGPLASVLLFPSRPHLVLAACSLWSLPAAVALDRIGLVAASRSASRTTPVPTGRIGFSAAALLCVLSGLITEWSRPELLDDEFLSRVAATREAGQRMEIDVDPRDRLRVLDQLGENPDNRGAENSLRVLVVSSPGRMRDSTRQRAYRKILESQHRAGSDDCLTLYAVEPSNQVAMRPAGIR